MADRAGTVHGDGHAGAGLFGGRDSGVRLVPGLRADHGDQSGGPGRSGAPTPPAQRRMPGRSRQRRPGLAALAVLLIVGGGAGATSLVMDSGQRVTAIEITSPVGAGQRISPGAMHPVRIAVDGGLRYVPWSQAPQVTRYYAAAAIPPGTLLTSAMVAQASSLADGRAVLGLALKDGQLPAGLAVGEHVELYQVSDASQACPGVPGGTLATDAIVISVSPPSLDAAGSATDVAVAVYPGDAGPVACSAANGTVALAELPAGPGAASPPAPSPSAPAQGRR